MIWILIKNGDDEHVRKNLTGCNTDTDNDSDDDSRDSEW